MFGVIPDRQDRNWVGVALFVILDWIINALRGVLSELLDRVLVVSDHLGLVVLLLVLVILGELNVFVVGKEATDPAGCRPHQVVA